MIPFLNVSSVCRKSLCTHCSDSFECTDCGETVCDDCAEDHFVLIEWAVEDCERLVCNKCGTFSGACASECRHCKDCQEYLPECAGCDNLLCNYCTESTWQCATCQETFCTSAKCLGPAKQCGVCDGLICSDCGEVEFCSGCSSFFRMAHHRFVDCRAPKTRHCRACGHKKRCQLCDSSCYEGCVCLRRQESRYQTGKARYFISLAS